MFPLFLGELTSYLTKTIFIMVEKKGMYAISRKKFLFTEKVYFLMIFCFTSNNKQKNTEYCHNILFFMKEIINDVFLNVVRSINGILNKTPFYKHNICNLNKEENSALKLTFWSFYFIFSFVGGRKPKKIHFLPRQYFFSL